MSSEPDTLAATYETDDLRRLAGRTGPFLTVVLPTPSDTADAAHRMEVRWHNARRDVVAAGWPTERVDELDAALADWPHGDAAALALLQSSDGHLLVETLSFGTVRRWSSIDRHPRLSTLLDNRQRTLPHLLVSTDRTGADIVGFDGGVIVETTDVEGETLHIHRGHPGGWSQRRFQQRAENTWETNADSVADATIEMASRIQPLVIAVAGEVRASTLVVDALGDRIDVPVHLLDAGDPDGIADETVRVVDDRHARLVRDSIEAFRDARGQDRAAVGDQVLDELRLGRVDTLLISDRPDRDDASETAGTGDQPRERLVDAATTGALETSASIVVVPTIAEMTDGVGAILRW